MVWRVTNYYSAENCCKDQTKQFEELSFRVLASHTMSSTSYITQKLLQRRCKSTNCHSHGISSLLVPSIYPRMKHSLTQTIVSRARHIFPGISTCMHILNGWGQRGKIHLVTMADFSCSAAKILAVQLECSSHVTNAYVTLTRTYTAYSV